MHPPPHPPPRHGTATHAAARPDLPDHSPSFPLRGRTGPGAGTAPGPDPRHGGGRSPPPAKAAPPGARTREPDRTPNAELDSVAIRRTTEGRGKIA